MKQALIYSLKVWITIVLLSPVLTTVLHFYNIQSNQRFLAGISRSVILNKLLTQLIRSFLGGFVLYLPVALALMGMLYLLRMKVLSIQLIKACFTIVVSILVVWPEALDYFQLGNSFGEQIAARALESSAIIVLTVAIVSIWFYKLKRINQTSSTIAL